MRGFRYAAAVCAAALTIAGCGGGGAGGGSSSTNGAQQLASVLPNAPVATGTTAWQLIAGDSRRNQALVANEFAPRTLTIDVGDSVTWTVKGSAHTISFGTPPANSNPIVPAGLGTGPGGTNVYDGTGYLNSGQVDSVAEGFPLSFTLTFTKAGTYAYFCQFHDPEMIGTIVVQPKGTPYPHSAGFYNGAGLALFNADLLAAQQSLQLFALPSGGTTLAAGISPQTSGLPSNASVLRFLDANHLSSNDSSTPLTVALGTTVTWVNMSTNEPHTVTVVPAGMQPPQDPFSPPSGGTTYDNTHVVNTGPLFPGQSAGITFTARGTFTYECLVHDAYHMEGTITVI